MLIYIYYCTIPIVTLTELENFKYYVKYYVFKMIRKWVKIYNCSCETFSGICKDKYWDGG